jgi:DNA-binding CsgD family transcriptional regulator
MGKHNKLTKAQIDEMLKRREAGEMTTAIAEAMGVSQETVSRYTKHISSRVELTPTQIEDIVRRVEGGETKRAVSDAIGVNESTIYKHTKHIVRRAPKLPPDLLKKVLSLGKEGKTSASIGRELGISQNTVAVNLAAVFADLTITRAQSIAIQEAYNKGNSIQQIALDLVIPFVDVYRELGVKVGKVIDATTREKIVRAMESGKSAASVAKQFGMSQSGASYVLKVAVEKGEAKLPAKKTSKSDDEQFGWMIQKDPELKHWRELVVGYYNAVKPPLKSCIGAVTAFTERYLLAQRLPLRPEDLLKRNQVLPDFYAVACPKSVAGKSYNTSIYNMIEWVLDSEQFADVEDGEPIRFNDLYRNPIDPNAGNGDLIPKKYESNKTLLSYFLVSLLRKQIAQGPNFKDWKWVQGLLGIRDLDGNNVGTDWFEVSEDRIDKSDPDCVFRIRRFANKNTPPVLEMWSPARWVHALLHLQTVVRGGQARMVDSGEADTFIWLDGKFVPNSGPLMQGTIRNPRQHGVFRRPSQADEAEGSRIALYFNSNKTGDMGKSGAEMGFECPWPQMDAIDEDPYYFLAKLRDWQMKYNPIKHLTKWSDLEGDAKLSVLSSERMQDYPDTAFLFRLPEMADHPDWPIGASSTNATWKTLMTAFEKALDEQDIRSPTGEQIELINPLNGRAWSSPHATRPSLITHLIMDGNVPPLIMMKVAGHARFIMTLYYTKAGLAGIQNAIKDGAKKLEESKYETFERDLKGATDERIRKSVVFNAENWTTVLPVNPADRSPIGWLHMHDRICLAGGNTHGDASVLGCHSGGPVIRAASGNNKALHAQVSGGVRNCSRCRFSASGKVHLAPLAATLSNRSWHLHKAEEEALATLRERDEILKSKARTEAANEPFSSGQSLTSAERRHEAAMQKVGELALDIAALHRTVERVKELPDNPDGTQALALQGDQLTAHTVIEDVSELMQLSVVVEDLELYPDLSAGVAVFDYADLLDRAFEREGHPPVLLRLSEKEKLICANAIMRALERQANPENLLLGRRTVVDIIDSGQSLEQLLGVKLKEIAQLAVPEKKQQTPLRLVSPKKEGNNDNRNAS